MRWRVQREEGQVLLNPGPDRRAPCHHWLCGTRGRAQQRPRPHAPVPACPPTSGSSIASALAQPRRLERHRCFADIGTLSDERRARRLGDKGPQSVPALLQVAIKEVAANSSTAQLHLESFVRESGLQSLVKSLSLANAAEVQQQPLANGPRRLSEQADPPNNNDARLRLELEFSTRAPCMRATALCSLSGEAINKASSLSTQISPPWQAKDEVVKSLTTALNPWLLPGPIITVVLVTVGAVLNFGAIHPAKTNRGLLCSGLCSFLFLFSHCFLLIWSTQRKL